MSQHCGRFRSLYESIVCFASIGILPAVLTVVLPIILTTASLSAAPQDTNAVAERMGNILAVKGQTLVITPDDNVRVNVGDRFEVLVALPGDLGEATVATGNVTSDAGGVVIGTLQNRDSKAKLASHSPPKVSAD